MMKILSKIKLLIIIGCFCFSTNAWAVIGDNTCPYSFNLYPSQAKGLSSNAPAAIKQAYKEMESIREKVLKICKNACRHERAYCTDLDQEKTMKADGTYNAYLELAESFKSKERYIHDYGAENSCGPSYPFGCPAGKKCYKVKREISNVRGGMAASITSNDTDDWDCLSDEEAEVGKRQQKLINMSVTVQREATADEEKTRESIVTSTNTAFYSESKTDENGNTSITTGYGGVDLYTTNLLPEYEKLDPRTNRSCDIKALKESYMSNCYSCTIVAVMINTFMTVADKTAPLTQEAGVKLMVIGMFLWLAFYVLKQISSLVAPEPMTVVQDLLRFLFKCVIAYTLITSGLGVISKMIVNPILGFGAEYGNIIIDTATPESAELNKYGDFDIKEYNTDLISSDVFGKIMRLSKKADAAVSLNFVIGDALTCHAHHAGAIIIAKKVQDLVGIEFYFPNVWLWLCGMAIWIMGLMVVIGINFYLLDLSFKVGFGLLALPITLGLMPFDKFQNKFTDCIKIIVNAAGTFMFLGITVGISVVLISASLGGTDELFHAIETDNKRYVAEQFSFTGAKFLLVAFAFLYSHKLISETVSKLTTKFFDSVTSSMNHMHTMAVGTTSYLGNAVKDKVGGTVGRITKGIGKGVDNLTAGALGAAAKGLRRGGRAIGRRFGKSSGGE